MLPLCHCGLQAQAIQSHSAREYPGEQQLDREQPAKQGPFSPLGSDACTLLPGLFKTHADLTKGYLTRLRTDNLLQNHYLEAGIRCDRSAPDMHQGWEAPQCQLRGHFAGHWLSAAAQFSAADQDAMLSLRVKELIRELARCQALNHRGWIGSIPEKYFSLMADGQPLWSPQYTVHKTLMGLLDAHRETGSPEALESLKQAADWFWAWTDSMIAENRAHRIYSGECAGMLELWVDLYSITHDEKHLRLAARYAMPDLFKALLENRDTLSNDHSNASIPWIQGAARLYEVTGDKRYRKIVEQFWAQAVDTRGMFATTGNNAGEFWIPKGQYNRFVGARTQEHCTVYNMLRVAGFLLRWTGESRYADYIERALYNGILAQNNPHTGMVSYFLPLQPGARKQWGSETQDFWCCHGTGVQAQAMLHTLIAHRTRDGLCINQYIPSVIRAEVPGGSVAIDVRSNEASTRAAFSAADNTRALALRLSIKAQSQETWTLRLRHPAWTSGPVRVTINGESVPVQVNEHGYLELKRQWGDAVVDLELPRSITREALPGDPSRFALLDGPVVLAALTSTEPVIEQEARITPRFEHQYVEGRDWQESHYMLQTTAGSVELVPLHEIADESYTVYLSSARP